MESIVRPIAGSYAFTDFIMNLVTGDLSEEDATHRTRNGEGASISWIIGHLCAYRYRAMKLLGSDRESPLEAAFGESTATDGSGYPTIEGLREAWETARTELSGVLESVTEEQLLSPLGGPATHDEKTVLDTLLFFVWHEAYHMGGLGLIRAELGYPATATLAVEAAEATS